MINVAADAGEQCDQMVLLFFQYLALYNNKTFAQWHTKLPK